MSILIGGSVAPRPAFLRHRTCQVNVLASDVRAKLLALLGKDMHAVAVLSSQIIWLKLFTGCSLMPSSLLAERAVSAPATERRSPAATSPSILLNASAP